MYLSESVISYSQLPGCARAQELQPAIDRKRFLLHFNLNYHTLEQKSYKIVARVKLNHNNAFIVIAILVTTFKSDFATRSDDTCKIKIKQNLEFT